MNALTLSLTFLSIIALTQGRLGRIYVDSDYAPTQSFITQNYCSNDGPVTFRVRYGASVPNCLLPPGPLKGCQTININIYSKSPYQCPNKGYVSGYSRVPKDANGNVIVRCCKALQVSYNDRECVRYFRLEDPKSPSPTKPGFYLIGSTPVFLPEGRVGFYNKECPFRIIKTCNK
ncbi:uncharacterized protein LOC125661927 [Ostrea edulis]|uniref:uncharacterized protein LOC125661927 n=1 Tax=Ostrea edulis TaxID=37623 RepID=UPI0024AFBF35|nr:uncharacterized protein LOC125661927 [Ostrea edulis]